MAAKPTLSHKAICALYEDSKHALMQLQNSTPLPEKRGDYQALKMIVDCLQTAVSLSRPVMVEIFEQRLFEIRLNGVRIYGSNIEGETFQDKVRNIEYKIAKIARETL